MSNKVTLERAQDDAVMMQEREEVSRSFWLLPALLLLLFVFFCISSAVFPFLLLLLRLLLVFVFAFVFLPNNRKVQRDWWWGAGRTGSFLFTVAAF